MIRNTIPGDPATICWLDDSIVDWASAGKQYTPDKKLEDLGSSNFNYKFDSAISSPDKNYVLIYERLGTKGLLLKNGELLREIDRSYYCADVYEYPAVFLTHNNITYLIHCPLDYCRLDIENVETGEIITDVPERDPQDIFHSRLELNSSQTYLLSKGWVWHPLNTVEVFNIADCIQNPLLLDKLSFGPSVGTEICTASFIGEDKVLIGSSDEVINTTIIDLPQKHIAIWDHISNKISQAVNVAADFGNLFAINEDLAWDTFKYPKIINIKTGVIVDADESIDSGEQNSSIIGSAEQNAPQIAFNRQTKQLAIKLNNQIEVLTPIIS